MVLERCANLQGAFPDRSRRDPQYSATNPFEWMDMISLQGKTNFFEKRVGDYQKSGVMSSVSGDGKGQAFRLDADF